MENYFKQCVLKSVGVEVKTSYNISEMLQILDCSRTAFYGYVANGTFTLTPHKRIYYSEVESYFNSSHFDPKKSDK